MTEILKPTSEVYPVVYGEDLDLYPRLGLLTVNDEILYNRAGDQMPSELDCYPVKLNSLREEVATSLVNLAEKNHIVLRDLPSVEVIVSSKRMLPLPEEMKHVLTRGFGVRHPMKALPYIPNQAASELYSKIFNNEDL